MALYVVLMLLVAAAKLAFAGIIPNAAHASVTRPGDVILGASFPIHRWSSGAPCSAGLYSWGMELSAIVMFAIEQINDREDLLPNVTIGYDIRDNCYSETLSLWTAFSLASTSERPQEDVQFPKISPPDNGSLLCIIGTQTSATTIPTAQAASLYSIPVISPFATSNELSDKRRFPYFLRTVPPDSLQASAIADILLRFEWKYIGLYFQLNTYGIHGAQSLLDLAEKYGICVAFSVAIRYQPKTAELVDAVDRLSSFPKAKVVVMIMDYQTASEILTTMSDVGLLSQLTFVGSDAWALPASLKRHGVEVSLLQGSLFVQQRFMRIAGFDYDRFIQIVESSTPWLGEWKAEHNCSDLSECPIDVDTNDNVVVDAVYAFSYALHNMLHDRCSNGTNCNSIQTLTGQDLLQYLLNVRFEGLAGNYNFDSNGDPGGNYKILNFQFVDGAIRAVEVGLWSAFAADPLKLNMSAVRWSETRGKPVSLCREDCQSGFIEVPLEEKCCFGCQRCPDEAIVIDNKCRPCPVDEWPDKKFEVCQPVIPTPPSWSEPTVIVIIILSVFGLVLSLLAAFGIYYYRGHVLIKAASRELSSINLLGLTLAFLAPFPLLAQVTDASCRVSEIIITLCFTLIYAPTLLKVNRIYRIFDTGKKSNKRPRFIGPRPQLMMAVIVCLFTVVICTAGTLISPTAPAKLYFSPPTGYIEAYCAFGFGSLVSTLFNLLLVLACCYYAFKARKVPSNYNESKFIAISVYSTLVFGMAAVPVYITATTVLQKVATLCVAILLNAVLTLLCVYLPKIYAIHFQLDVQLSFGIYYYRRHVLIKAASCELSSINILGLTLAFLAPFPLLIPPTAVLCRASEIIVALCFTLTYAPTLLKVNRIYRIFDAGKKSNKRPCYTGATVQLIFVLGIIASMVAVAMTGALASPTLPAKLYFFPRRNYIEVFCQFGNGFLASLVSDIPLILACCYYAFKARKVPSNYNESRFIAIIVYSTLVFGMAAVPVYITATTVLQKVATLCVAILLNAFLTLFCVYLPKVYAIQLDSNVEIS
ncbi:metabotropic glutamate receptor-like [Acanthaster planci]|uniref:Metabotropic glutamate receptor-like n=1 Tax=Acanthaster planci TaxID=133434 RepID=A0A8B7YYE1_ACAPL|nr:metabotropic glutamate receptor-like [Acanthaster planci]